MNRTRGKKVASGTQHRAGRLRLAAVVYAAVVILGLAGNGAHALWSQSGTAVASVSTGSWGPKPVQENTVDCSARAGLLATAADVVVNFDFPTDSDAVTVAITDGAGTVRTQTISRGATVQGKATIRVASGLFKWNNKAFPVTLTSSYKGTSDVPVNRSVTWTLGFLEYAASC